MRWSPGFSLKRSRHTTFAVLSVFRHDPLSYLFLKLSDHLGRYMFLVEAQVDLTELGETAGGGPSRAGETGRFSSPEDPEELPDVSTRNQHRQHQQPPAG